MLLIKLAKYPSAGYVIAFLTLISLSGCGSTPDTQQINDHIHALAKDVEEKSTDGVLERLNETFNAKHFRTKKDIQRLLILSFLKYKRISVLLTNIQVTVSETYTDQAVATFNAVATSGSGLIPNEGQAYRFTTDWIKVEDEWLLQSAEWKRAFE